MSQGKLQNILKSKTQKVYKNKKLNTANFGNFTHNDYQVFLYLVSKIGGVDEERKYLQPEQLEREHTLTAKEFSEVFNTDLDNGYKYLKKSVDKLMKTDLKIAKNESTELWRINVCSMAKYQTKKGCIVVKFTDDIMSYLAQVRQKFVLYNLKEIANFSSLYTTRLYELIQEFKDTGCVIKSIEQLREAFAVGNNFDKYNNFKRRTFDHACKEINNNYEMNLGYEEIKEGRKVVAIKFVFKKTKIHKVTNQRTGVEKNLYIKPKKTNNPKDVIEKQMSLDEIEKESKAIKNTISRLFDKFKF